MKQLLFFLALIATLSAQSQTLLLDNTYGKKVNRQLPLIMQGLPRDTIAPPTTPENLQVYPWIAMKGDSIYIWSTTLLKYILYSGGGGGGSQNLQQTTAIGNATDKGIRFIDSVGEEIDVEARHVNLGGSEQHYFDFISSYIGYRASLSFIYLTGDQVYHFPNASGTIALQADSNNHPANMLWQDAAGNLHKAVLPSGSTGGRFGIEDNTSSVDRAINFKGLGLRMDSLKIFDASFYGETRPNNIYDAGAKRIFLAGRDSRVIYDVGRYESHTFQTGLHPIDNYMIGTKQTFTDNNMAYGIGDEITISKSNNVINVGKKGVMDSSKSSILIGLHGLIQRSDESILLASGENSAHYGNEENRIRNGHAIINIGRNRVDTSNHTVVIGGNNEIARTSTSYILGDNNKSDSGYKNILIGTSNRAATTNNNRDGSFAFGHDNSVIGGGDNMYAIGKAQRVTEPYTLQAGIGSNYFVAKRDTIGVHVNGHDIYFPTNGNLKDTLLTKADLRAGGVSVGGSSVDSLKNLPDVNTTSTTNNDVLKFDSTTGKWKNVPSVTYTFTDLQDGDILRYDSSLHSFINTPFVTDSIRELATPPTAGNIYINYDTHKLGVKTGSIWLYFTASDSTAVGSYDTDAATFIANTGMTDAGDKAAINAFVLGLKSNGLWSKCYGYWPLYGGSFSSGKYDLKNTHTLTQTGTGTFSGGFTNTTSSLDGLYTGVVGNTNSGNLSIFASVKTDLDDLKIDFGAKDDNLSYILSRYTTGTIYAMSNIYTWPAEASGIGRFYAVHSGTTTEGYKNGTSAGSTTGTNGSTTSEFIIGNGGGTSTNYASSRKISMAGVFQSLTSGEITTLDGLISTLEGAWGR